MPVDRSPEFLEKMRKRAEKGPPEPHSVFWRKAFLAALDGSASYGTPAPADVVQRASELATIALAKARSEGHI
jgi:hypothetical protein